MNNELISHFSLDMNDYNYERTLNCKRLNKRLSLTTTVAHNCHDNKKEHH